MRPHRHGELTVAGYYNRRDLIGHWITKRQQVGMMCPHACCRNHRVHPANMPVILPDPLLKRASDQDLATHFEKVSAQRTADETAAYWQIMAEMERRDERDERRRANRAAAQARYKELAFSRRMERAEAVEQAYVTAEADTKGNMLNKAGRAAGVDERTLFTGPESRARRYASDELLEHWATHPRPTSAMFAGKDTRVYERYTAPKRKERGVVARHTIRGRGRRGQDLTVTVLRRAG